MNKVKSFLNETNELLQCAVAVAICQSRPPNLSLKEYVSQIQEKAKKKFGPFEQSQLSQDENLTACEQEWAMSQLNDFLSQTVTCTTESPENEQTRFDDNEDMICEMSNSPTQDDNRTVDDSSLTHEMAPNEKKDSESSTSQTVGSEKLDSLSSSMQTQFSTPVQEILSNSNFIIAVMQLKNMIKSKPSVPAEEVRRIVSLATKAAQDLHNKSESVSNFNSSQQSSEFKFCGSVSSSSVNFLMRNLNINSLVIKSLDTVLNHLVTVITTSGVESLEDALINWKDSMIGQTVQMVSDVIDSVHRDNHGYHECVEMCCKFVKDVMGSIWKGINITEKFLSFLIAEKHEALQRITFPISASLHQRAIAHFGYFTAKLLKRVGNLVWELTCEIILPLAKREHVCPEVITSLLDELLNVITCTEDLREAEPYKYTYKMARVAERSFYYFNFLKSLLNQYQLIHKKIVNKKVKKISDSSDDISFEGLWKKAFVTVPIPEMEMTEKSFALILQWQKTLAKCSEICENQPFQKLYVEELKHILETFDKDEHCI